MIFASRTPRDLNHDPEPFKCISCSDRFAREKNGATSSHVTNFTPRAKFDHVQHNEPNPILVDMREPGRDRDAYIRGFLLARPWRYRWPNWTQAQTEHARRVLNRLANISG